MIKLIEQIDTLTRWQTRSATEQMRIAIFLLFASVLLPLLIWSWINASVRENQSETEQVIQRYERALPLAEVIIQGLADVNEAASLSPLAAAQQITRDMGIEDRLASIRPARAAQGRDGVQLHMESLNLPELLYFFASIRNQAGLQIVSGNLTKRLDNPSLIDLTLVLTR